MPSAFCLAQNVFRATHSRVQRVVDDVAVAVLHDDVLADERGERRLHARRAAAGGGAPHVSRQQLAAVLEDHRAQHRALRQRQALPRFLEDGVLLVEQPRQRQVQVLEPRRLPARRPHVVPRLVRQPLHVVGHVVGELDDGRAEAVLRLHAARRESRVDEVGETSLVDLLQAHDRARPCRTAAAASSIRSISDGSEPANT